MVPEASSRSGGFHATLDLEQGGPRQFDAQVTLALGLLFGLRGIPCLYYGSEYGLRSTRERYATLDVSSLPLETVREALWASRMLSTAGIHSFGRPGG